MPRLARKAGMRSAFTPMGSSTPTRASWRWSCEPRVSALGSARLPSWPRDLDAQARRMADLTAHAWHEDDLARSRLQALPSVFSPPIAGGRAIGRPDLRPGNGVLDPSVLDDHRDAQPPGRPRGSARWVGFPVQRPRGDSGSRQRQRYLDPGARSADLR